MHRDPHRERDDALADRVELVEFVECGGGVEVALVDQRPVTGNEKGIDFLDATGTEVQVHDTHDVGIEPVILQRPHGPAVVELVRDRGHNGIRPGGRVGAGEGEYRQGKDNA
ncbi:hypothetical protein ACFL5A_04255 [Gemmatimonadota bacterium]